MARDRRRLAAIFAADMVGFSAKVERDEVGTLARLKRCRDTLLVPTLLRNHGRLVKLTGDGALAEFPSAADAVAAAIEFQIAVAEESDRAATEIQENASATASEPIEFRVGLHLGELVADGDDIYGNTVNIASRLEALAEPGQILVSAYVRDAVAGRMAVEFEDRGDLELKNIVVPVRAFHLIWRAEDWPALASVDSGPPSSPAMPGKPSIAILPFANVSGDPERGYFVDGVGDDVITELSRFKSLFVIARNSTYSYKGKTTDIRTVGKELGVRFVLEGSVRAQGDRIRVTAQLSDSVSGNSVWSERYDRVVEDVFAVQESITQSIVGAIAPQIDVFERDQARRRRPENLTAYETALRAAADAEAAWITFDRTLRVRAIETARQALAIDPRNSLALRAFALAQFHQWHFRAADDIDAARRDGMAAAAAAIEIDATDAHAYVLQGMFQAFATDADRIDEALVNMRKAELLNPNDAFIKQRLGLVEIWAGNLDRGIDCLQQALRLSPRDPQLYIVHNTLTHGYFLAKDYARALEHGLQAANSAPNSAIVSMTLAVTYVGLGAIAKAKAAMAAARQQAPEFVQARLEGYSFYRLPEHRHRSSMFLRIAEGLEDPAIAAALR